MTRIAASSTRTRVDSLRVQLAPASTRCEFNSLRVQLARVGATKTNTMKEITKATGKNMNGVSLQEPAGPRIEALETGPVVSTKSLPEDWAER